MTNPQIILNDTLKRVRESHDIFEENLKSNAKIRPQRQSCSIDFVEMKRKFETMLEDIHSKIKDK